MRFSVNTIKNLTKHSESSKWILSKYWKKHKKLLTQENPNEQRTTVDITVQLWKQLGLMRAWSQEKWARNVRTVRCGWLQTHASTSITLSRYHMLRLITTIQLQKITLIIYTIYTYNVHVQGDRLTVLINNTVLLLTLTDTNTTLCQTKHRQQHTCTCTCTCILYWKHNLRLK